MNILLYIGLIFVIMPLVESVLILFGKNRFIKVLIFVIPIMVTILYSFMLFDIKSESCGEISIFCVYQFGFLVTIGVLTFLNYLIMGIGILISKRNRNMGIK